MIRAGTRAAAVVDASVALKWLVPEPESDAAVELRRAADAGTIRLYAPQHWLAEVANVLWVRTRRSGSGALSADEARDRARELVGVGVHLRALSPVLVDAFEISHAADVTLYDALYVAAAEQLGVHLITADRRLIARLSGTRWAGVAEALASWSMQTTCCLTEHDQGNRGRCASASGRAASLLQREMRGRGTYNGMRA